MSVFVDDLFAKLRPEAPFADVVGDKGWLNIITSAQPFQITKLDLKIPGWSNRESRLKIGLLSDIHLGSHANDVSRLSEIVSVVNAWNPDIILLLGDFMNTQVFGGGRIPPRKIANILQSLSSRHGTYEVLGNHDWHYDGHSVWTALERQGIVVLENASKKIKDTQGDFSVIGLADEQTRQVDIDSAFLWSTITNRFW